MTPSSDMSPLISVVVCTRNSKDRALDNLESLHNQTLDRDRYEVLVVDNASDDGTDLWLEKRSDRLGYRLLKEPELGLSSARNLGIREAKGDLIFFIDDDAVAPAHLIETLAEDFVRENADVVGGPVHGLWEETPPQWLQVKAWRSLSLVSWGRRKRMLVYPEILLGCNVAFRREVFEKYGLFDTSLGRKGDNLKGNEERELERRIHADGGKVFYNPRAYVFHLVPSERLRLDYFEKRARDGAYSVLAMSELKGEQDAQRERWERFEMEPRWKNALRSLYDAVRSRAVILIDAVVHVYGFYKFAMKVRRASSEGRRDFYRDRRIIR